MNRTLIHCFLICRTLLHTLTTRRRPPARMPSDMINDFTQGGTIPVLQWYINDAVTRPLRWRQHYANRNERRIVQRKQKYYGKTDFYLYQALEKYSIQGKDVVIVGSETPWYECICLHFGAKVTTIEYRDVACDIAGLTVLNPHEFQQNPRKFDVVVSISSIEHSGLGRYGDPINPRGDLEEMDTFGDLLKPGGLLFLAVPIGRDAVVWNAHRIYGRRRLPRLFSGWRQVDAFGHSEDQFNAKLGRWDLQPVFVLSRTGGAGFVPSTGRPEEISAFEAQQPATPNNSALETIGNDDV